MLQYANRLKSLNLIKIKNKILNKDTIENMTTTDLRSYYANKKFEKKNSQFWNPYRLHLLKYPPLALSLENQVKSRKAFKTLTFL